MTTRLFKNNRVTWASERRRPAVPWYDESKNHVKRVGPSALRSGRTWYDADNDISFRVVSPGVLKAEEGWGQAGFWISRHLRTTFAVFRELVRKGYFDAAIEEDLLVRKYRVLDLAAVYAYLQELADAARKQRVKEQKRESLLRRRELKKSAGVLDEIVEDVP